MPAEMFTYYILQFKYCIFTVLFLKMNILIFNIIWYMENMGLCYLYSMITIVRKKKVNPRIMGERGGVLPAYSAYQSDPTDHFGNDVSIFEDGYLCMYLSSRRRVPTL